MDRGEQPLLVVRTNPLMNFVLSMRTIYPTSLAVFEDAVENIAVRGIIATNVQRVRYDQMARVFVRHGIISADLVVETRGGATLEVRGASKREAEHASTVSGSASHRDRLGAPRTPLPWTCQIKYGSWQNCETPER